MTTTHQKVRNIKVKIIRKRGLLSTNCCQTEISSYDNARLTKKQITEGSAPFIALNRGCVEAYCRQRQANQFNMSRDLVR